MAGHSPTFLRRFARGVETLKRTRTAVVAGWREIALQLEEAGGRGLADLVSRFVEQMPPPTTDQLQLARRFGACERHLQADSIDRTL